MDKERQEGVRAELFLRSEANKAGRAPALAWSAHLAVPHSLAWLEHTGDLCVLQAALQGLFASEGFPAGYSDHELLWLRDPLGKPYVEWQGVLSAWAAQQGRHSRHLHVSNTHDGDAHLVLASYAEDLIGVGVDAVHLPRLRRPGKDANYLLRFARQFMSALEWETFLAAAAQEDEERLRLRVAAHFSLMESAAKACGTGLKIGAGMGKPDSLPKRALGVRTLAPAVELIFGPEAQDRLEQLGVGQYEGYWGTDGEYLISVVLLWKNLSHCLLATQ